MTKLENGLTEYELSEEYHKCEKCNFWHHGKKETYVIHSAKYEIVDHYGYCLGLDFRQEGSGFFLFFTDLKEIQKMLETAKVSKIEDLVGKPCWCYVDEKNTGHFLRMWSL